MFIPNKSFSMGDKAKFIIEFLAKVDSVVEAGDVNSSFNWDWTLKIKLKRKKCIQIFHTSRIYENEVKLDFNLALVFS